MITTTINQTLIQVLIIKNKTLALDDNLKEFFNSKKMTDKQYVNYEDVIYMFSSLGMVISKSELNDIFE